MEQDRVFAEAIPPLVFWDLDFEFKSSNEWMLRFFRICVVLRS
jgi:hypothetical protein